jgi:nicotinate-nucleotide adenylyltransferase
LQYYRTLTNTGHIAVIGGTFDPIHFGHLVIAEEVYATLKPDTMVFVPAGQPPHKPGQIVTPAQDRLTMLELAIASNPHFTISRVDLDRPGPSYTVETLRLLREQWGEQTAIDFVIGWDSLEDLLDWYDPAGILKQLDHLVAVNRPGYPAPIRTADDASTGDQGSGRPQGYAPAIHGDAYQPLIVGGAGTEETLEEQDEKGYIDRLEERLPGIRQRLIILSAPQLKISATALRQRVAEGRPIKYQVPDVVEQYILDHGLYRQV